jgi:hypothetical protein
LTARLHGLAVRARHAGASHFDGLALLLRDAKRIVQGQLNDGTAPRTGLLRDRVTGAERETYERERGRSRDANDLRFRSPLVRATAKSFG